MKVNGAIIVLEESISLVKFLSTHSYDFTRIAVERNGEIVPRTSYKDIMLYDEDTLEIVRFVGGG